MKRNILIVVCIIALVSALSAQKVGLVLSGGGARGLAHIGIIQALEENHIPIDYITGTSMGAIVGGLYAMGYTPDEMIKIIKSEDFIRWSTGEMEPEYVYYYRNAEPKPKFVDLPFRIEKRDSVKIKPNILPTNLVSPRQMNYAFLPLFAQANAVSGGNFDKLFVPFRCVASDIYKKEQVICRKGDLGDAVRASMTFPFMFKPIVIDGRLLFDGGIFNNFPVDVMCSDFNPDFMIGSVVSDNPTKPDEQDIVMQIQNMIMSHTDYSLSPSDGVLLRFRRSAVNTFDFAKVDELVKNGYDSTIAHMPEIVARVKRQVTPAEVAERRKNFKASFPTIQFKNVSVEGVDSLQEEYVERVFHSDNDVFNLMDFKKAYFKLISDDKISEVLPHAVFDTTNCLYNLKLHVKVRDQLKFSLGGNVSSSTSNEAYLGVVYQNLKEYAQTAYMDAQFGKMYNGLGFGSRIEIPTKKNWYVKAGVVLHAFDYYKGSRLFYNDDRTADFTQYEAYGKISVGFPLGMKGRFEFGAGYGAMSDYYRQELVDDVKDNDRSSFSLGSISGRVESSTLNDIMYPTRGAKYSACAQLIGGEEVFRPASALLQTNSESNSIWLQLRGKMDDYFYVSKYFSLGTYAELAFSTRELLKNYTVSVIQAPIFQPTPHSKTVFNEAFCANKFAVLGVKPIYKFNRQLHLRNESYLFIPYKTFDKLQNNAVGYSKSFRSTEFMNETSLVFNFRFASASMFMNYYSTAASRWNFGINIGFLLFNPKFID